jgi:hypothetical protein
MPGFSSDSGAGGVAAEQMDGGMTAMDGGGSSAVDTAKGDAGTDSALDASSTSASDASLDACLIVGDDAVTGDVE